MLITRQIFTTNYKYIGFTAVRPGVWTDADDASSMRHVCTTHVLNITELITETDNNYSPFVADSLPTDDYGIYRATYQHQCQWMYAVHELVTEHSLTSHCVGMSVLCEYAIAAYFSRFSKVHISHIFMHINCCDPKMADVGPPLAQTSAANTNCTCAFPRLCQPCNHSPLRKHTWLPWPCVVSCGHMYDARFMSTCNCSLFPHIYAADLVFIRPAYFLKMPHKMTCPAVTWYAVANLCSNGCIEEQERAYAMHCKHITSSPQNWDL